MAGAAECKEKFPTKERLLCKTSLSPGRLPVHPGIWEGSPSHSQPGTLGCGCKPVVHRRPRVPLLFAFLPCPSCCSLRAEFAAVLAWEHLLKAHPASSPYSKKTSIFVIFLHCCINIIGYLVLRFLVFLHLDPYTTTALLLFPAILVSLDQTCEETQLGVLPRNPRLLSSLVSPLLAVLGLLAAPRCSSLRFRLGSSRQSNWFSVSTE